MNKDYIKRFLKGLGHTMVNHPINRMIKQIDENAVLSYAPIREEYMITTIYAGMRRPYIAIRLKQIDETMVYNLVQSPRFKTFAQQQAQLEYNMELADRNEARANKEAAREAAVRYLEGY